MDTSTPRLATCTKLPQGQTRHSPHIERLRWDALRHQWMQIVGRLAGVVAGRFGFAAFVRRASGLLIGGALALGVASGLVGCGGVPIRSIPSLVQMPKLLLDAQPAELRLALQVDKRLTPPPGAAPLLTVRLEPKHPATASWQRLDKRWPLQLDVRDAAPRGLPAASPDRRWMVYSLMPAAYAELQQVQARLKAARQDDDQDKVGKVSIGIEQNSLATDDPKLLKSQWNTWFQVSESKGYLEIWNGTLEDIRKSARPR